MSRSITLVRAMVNGDTAPKSVAGILNSASAEALALMRFLPHSCGHCGGRVNLRVQSVGTSGTTGGLRAYFAHAVDEGVGCPAVTQDACRADEIGATMFGGKQEGPRHRQMKDMMLAAAAADAAVTFAQAEVYLTYGNAGRRPDVVVGINDQLVCCDIQLAPPPRITISGRTAFYEPACFRHAWVLDGAALDRVNLQPFQDLLWRQGGRTLAFDEECLEKSVSSKALTFKLVTITDEGNLITTAWHWVQGDDLLACLGMSPTDTGTAKDFLSQAFLAALASTDRADLQRWYEAVGPDLGLSDWNAFRVDGLRPLLGALASVLASEVRDGSARRPSEVTAVVHNALTTGLSDGRHLWAPIITMAMKRRAELPNAVGFGLKTAAMIDRASRCHDPAEFNRRIDVWRPLLLRLVPALALP
ncbi:hypothetical protein [Pseudotabrizicola sp.]|uniref:competence protein CoiA family protein n=1 Tax=Pseudotabrizicola sp. TaxID=2939647 RepID=UPI00272F4149|nr:hypothetical protein [Pseudotabrizicola sp.]